MYRVMRGERGILKILQLQMIRHKIVDRVDDDDLIIKIEVEIITFEMEIKMAIIRME